MIKNKTLFISFLTILLVNIALILSNGYFVNFLHKEKLDDQLTLQQLSNNKDLFKLVIMLQKYRGTSHYSMHSREVSEQVLSDMRDQIRLQTEKVGNIRTNNQADAEQSWLDIKKKIFLVTQTPLVLGDDFFWTVTEIVTAINNEIFLSKNSITFGGYIDGGNRVAVLNLVVDKIYEYTESVGQLRGLGSRVISDQKLGRKNDMDLHLYQAKVEQNQEKLLLVLAKVFSAFPELEIGLNKILYPGLVDKQYVFTSNASNLFAENIEAKDFFANGTSIIDDLELIHNIIIDQAVKIANQEISLNNNIIKTLCCLIFVVLISSGFLFRQIYKSMQIKQQAEEQLLQMNMHLEEKVLTRTQALEQQKEKLEHTNLSLAQAKQTAEKASNVKSEFLAVMTHEIRTPLNGILGISQILLESTLNAKQKEQVSTLFEAGENLLRIIDDVLCFSKIEANKIELESHEYELKKILQNIEKLFSKKITDKEIKISIDYSKDCPEKIRGDKHRLQQVIMNVVSNALKFSPRQGEISLRIVRVDQEYIKISCIDQGIGIEKEKQKDLFKHFSQIDSSTTRIYGGTGLGLAICKSLVEIMGGKIGVESQVNKGSEFWFIVPINLDEHRKAIVNGEAEVISIAPRLNKFDNEKLVIDPATNTSKRLLLVEDDQLNQDIFIHFIKELGLQVSIANNGAEGVDLARKQHFDIIIMDCLMPVLDGFEATRQIRADSLCQQTPIIAATANAITEIKNKCFAAGMNDFCTKPLKKQLLIEKIQQWLQSSKLA